MRDVTKILESIQQGDLARAGEELLPLVYQELRRLAAHKMAREAPGQTLQPTALVHEAWLRLAGKDNPKFQGRAHFFGAAAEAMRRILIERARRKRRQRHGDDQKRVDFEEAEIAAAADDDELIAIDEALGKLAVQHQKHAELVKLRFFVGMTIEEAADAMDISKPTADRYWAYAKAWLHTEIQKSNT